MHWLPWSAEAFARAARERKPILLSISATWCRACHEMDRTTYADPDVEAIARTRFVAVRVDTDQRPDINDRYNLGGWPTTAFLTPEGALLGGGTFLDAARMTGVLEQLADTYASRGASLQSSTEIGPGVRATDPVGSPSIEGVFATFDEECGGFGLEPKFPLTAPLLLATSLYRESAEPRWRRIVERTLDAMAGGGLYDRVSGGFYRYATTRDWQLAHEEKLLATNAALLGAFADAFATFGRPEDRECATGLAAFINHLASPTGGYADSDAGAGVYAASTAAAASALLATADALQDSTLAQEALGRFEAFLLTAYRPGSGIGHYVDGGPKLQGLLIDQVATADALLSAYALTGDEPYRMMAEEIGLFMLRTLAAPGGGFYDRTFDSADLGLLRSRRLPFAGNCEAARVFAQLARVSRESAFHGVARRALDCVAAETGAHGPDGAYWLLAARDPSIR